MQGGPVLEWRWSTIYDAIDQHYPHTGRTTLVFCVSSDDSFYDNDFSLPHRATHIKADSSIKTYITSLPVVLLHSAASFYGLSQQTRDVEPMLGRCWASVVDAGPTSTQHWFHVLFLCLLLTQSVRNDALVSWQQTIPNTQFRTLQASNAQLWLVTDAVAQSRD